MTEPFVQQKIWNFQVSRNPLKIEIDIPSLLLPLFLTTKKFKEKHKILQKPS